MCSVCSVVKKNGIATQTQDHLPNGVGLLHQLIDRLERGDNYLLRNRLWPDQTHGDKLFSQSRGFG